MDNLITTMTDKGKNTITTMTDKGKNTIIDLIKSKYCITLYPRISVSKSHEFDDGSTLDTSYLPSNLMLYYLFHKKYPDSFKTVALPTGETFIGIPKIGIYITNYKNHIFLCNVYYANIFDNQLEEMVSKYTVRLDIIGKNPHEMYTKCFRLSLNRNKKLVLRNMKLSRLVPIYGEPYDEPSKDISDIIMSSNNKNKLLSALNNFYNADIYEYRKMGIKKHLGILLYGPPGTGKSSLAFSIAAHFSKCVQIITPENVADKLKNFPYDGIILFEEIDSFLKDKGGNNNNIVLRRDQLLSFIDRIPQGNIVIATTNYIEDLDDAITRPGRFDLKIHMDLFSREDAIVFFGEKYSYMVDQYEYPVIPSQLQFDLSQEVMKKSILLQSTDSE